MAINPSIPEISPVSESKNPAEVNASVASMIEVIDRIIEVTERENRLFAEGHPAPPEAMVKVKSSQADLLADWLKAVQDGAIDLKKAEAGLREGLTARVKRMRVVLGENEAKIAQARAASRRRVEAIMQIVREQGQNRAATYGGSGMLAATKGRVDPVCMSVKL